MAIVYDDLIVTMLGFLPKSPTMKVLHGAARLLVRAASCDVATSERCFLLQERADTAVHRAKIMK